MKQMEMTRIIKSWKNESNGNNENDRYRSNKY